MSRALIDARIAQMNESHYPYVHPHLGIVRSKRHLAELRVQHQGVATITLCYEASRSDGRVWAVKVGRRWRLASHVTLVGVTLETVYKGPQAKQPRAYLTGRGRVVWQGTTARITS